jgi:Fe-S-cluster-containing dehydrogenase component
MKIFHATKDHIRGDLQGKAGIRRCEGSALWRGGEGKSPYCVEGCMQGSRYSTACEDVFHATASQKWVAREEGSKVYDDEDITMGEVATNLI